MAQRAILSSARASSRVNGSPVSPPIGKPSAPSQLHAAPRVSRLAARLQAESATPAPVPQRFYPEWQGLEIEPRKFSLFTKSHIPELFSSLAPKLDPKPFVAAATVLPMRTNPYVVEELINWRNIPNDPMFQLVFPQPGMLQKQDLQRVQASLDDPEKTKVHVRDITEEIRQGLNPHPAGQKDLNVPSLEDTGKLKGMQHKYRETVLFFPSEGQFCHSFCTYCFRWAQFTAVGSDQQFASRDAQQLVNYLQRHEEVSDVLFTGGDPMVMKTHMLSNYVDAILDPKNNCHNIGTIRFGTKAVAYWPHRFVTDPDADDLLRLFERVVKSGRHLSIMAHFSNPVELSTPVAQEAIRRIRSTGAQVRCQAPLIRHVNDDASVWADMWRLQTRLGAIPYYMFVERDTGARHYFEVPLARAHRIFTDAVSAVAGTARTVRGPSMSAGPGKVHVVGETTVGGERAFVLNFLQARNPAWCNQPFFAKWDPKASWLDHLTPAFGQKWFWEDEYKAMAESPTLSDGGSDTSSGQQFAFEPHMKYSTKLWPVA